MNTYIKPELLSPAGSMEGVFAAVENGCSAVYAGGAMFNARQNARNFSLQELENAVDYCHARGVKLYAAANTLVKNSEIKSFIDFAENIRIIGADGIIVQDIGAASLIRKRYPDFYLLGSTQMTVHDANGANLLNEEGFGRVIVSRELSLKELSTICRNSKADIECFVHGALCVCYSGQCMMSSFIGGRSGNRGLCAQPCRLMYDIIMDNEKITKGNVLSAKDICGLETLPKLIEIGVKSFKIEGRMKSPEYVACVTAAYRKYIDLYYDDPNNYSVDFEDVTKLAQIFNRGGFTDGYFSNYSGRHMLTEQKVGNTGVYIGIVSSVRDRYIRFKPLYDVYPGDGIEIYADVSDGEIHPGAYILKKHKAGEAVEVRINSNAVIKNGDLIYRTYDKCLMDSLKSTYERLNRKSEITGVFSAALGQEMSLIVTLCDISVSVTACPPEKAKSAPTDSEKVRAQLSKTGGTPFEFTSLEMHIDDGLFLSVSVINQLRRDALAELEARIIGKSKKTHELSEFSDVLINMDKRPDNGNAVGMTVLVRSAEQLDAVMEFVNDNISRIYIDFVYADIDVNALKAGGADVYLCLPRIEREMEGFAYGCKSLDNRFDGYLIRTYGQLKWAIDNDVNYAADYTMNVFNDYSMDFYGKKHCKSVCVSPELSIAEAGGISGKTEMVAYGKLVVMTTVQCPIGNFPGNKNSGPFCKYKGTSHSFKLISGKQRDSYELLTNCALCYCQLVTGKPKISEPSCDLYRIELSNENYVGVKNIMSTYLR